MSLINLKLIKNAPIFYRDNKIPVITQVTGLLPLLLYPMPFRYTHMIKNISINNLIIGQAFSYFIGNRYGEKFVLYISYSLMEKKWVIDKLRNYHNFNHKVCNYTWDWIQSKIDRLNIKEEIEQGKRPPLSSNEKIYQWLLQP